MNNADPRFQAARLVLALRQAGVMDQRVMEALEKSPRELFAPRIFEEDAWENVELPIDCGQTMTRPVTVGIMLQALEAQRDHTVLEVGTGTGYVAAVLTKLVRRVYTVDRYRTLVDKARSLIDRLHMSSRIEVRMADGLTGWPEAAPFDRVLLMGSVPALPEDIARQVGQGGVVVMPVERDGRGLIVRLQKQADGSFAETVVAQGGFAPLEPGIAREL